MGHEHTLGLVEHLSDDACRGTTASADPHGHDSYQEVGSWQLQEEEGRFAVNIVAVSTIHMKLLYGC